jgi:hypothetical protein
MRIYLIAFFVVIVVITVIVWTRSKRAEGGSYQPVTSFPDPVSEIAQHHKFVSESASRLSGDEASARQLVKHFIFEVKLSSDAWTEKQIIAKLGAETYPHALEILRDSSTHRRLTTLAFAEGHSLQEAPICRLAQIFDQDAPPPPESADLLALFLQSESPEIRKWAALIVGSVGSPESLPAFQKAIGDENDYVKTFALMGLQRAIRGGRIDISESSRIFDVVAGMWPENTDFNVCRLIPRVLLDLDHVKAVKRLTHPDVFTARFAPVWMTLEAFVEIGVDIPDTYILTLIAETRREQMEYPMDEILKWAKILRRQVKRGHDANAPD